MSSRSPQEEVRFITKPKIKSQPKAKASSKHNNKREGNEEDEEEKEIIVGFPWASSRAYTCGFCKRQFQSAQALGGHMNVHRRDRAKLRRRSPPLLDSTTHDHHQDFHGSSSQPIKFFKLYDFSSFHGEEADESTDGGCKIWKKVNKFVKKKKEAVNLLGSSNDIDLELRLGF